jgi:hypothetical protein
MRWDEAAVAEMVARGPEFPRYCTPRSLRWYPSSARAEAAYDGACLRRNGVEYLSLIAYNARDLNLEYVFVSYRDSRNIAKPDPPTTAYRNPQYLHRGNSCGYPGGCNNISPQTPEIDGIRITGFPAEVVIWFWQDDPGSTEKPPDMVFVIRFD